MSNVAWDRVAAGLEKTGAAPEDTEEIRLQKRLLLAVALMVAPAGLLWGGIYVLFDEPAAGIIPLFYGVVSYLSIAHFALTRRYRFFRFSQLLLFLLLPFFLMVFLGGFVSGSVVIIWSLLCPLGALLFADRRQAAYWFAAFIGLVALSGVLEFSLDGVNNLAPTIVTTFFVMNIAVPSAIVVALVSYFVGQKNSALALLGEEQERTDRLLKNVLPDEIAEVLKRETRTIADRYGATSILFADVVGFTPLAAQIAPEQVVSMLNEIFSHFDGLAEKYGVEKIRTMGDGYLAASGVPAIRDDHAPALARMALDMSEYAHTRLARGDSPLQIRVGMHSGPVVAGVIGHTKFHYDLWGDTVNTASRMESQGVPGRIQISEETFELIRDEFLCEPRGTIDVKGKGEMKTWFLEGVNA